MMKAVIHPPVHESYLKHRRQLTWQIILPVALAVVLCLGSVVLLNLAAFRGDADVTRWAAVSTIWISIPVILFSFVVFAILAGLVYLLLRLLQVAPVYTGKAQDFVYKLSGYVKRGADMAVKPVFFLDEAGATLKALLGKK
ncbi:MAG TPA: hypothetical protein VI524_09145 [Anaerolineales bacterium]|nr:hypothetical protein [Anaerolineales bacterium]